MAERKLREFSAEREGITWIATPTVHGNSDYGKYFYVDPETGILLKENLYPRGMKTPWHRHTHAHGMYVLEGQIKTNKGLYGPGTFIWWPAGSVAEHGATMTEDARMFFMTTGLFDLHFLEGPDPAKDAEGLVEYVVDTNEMEWEEVLDAEGNCYLEKKLLNDETTGMQISVRRFPAEYETGWHKHDSSNGYYILKGIYKSDQGFYGPGSFVWYPEGTVARHGSAKYTDAEVVFVSDKKENFIPAFDPSNWDRA